MRLHNYLRLAAGVSAILVVFPLAAAQETTPAEDAIAGIARLREAIGAYRAEYDVATVARFPDRGLDRAFDLFGKFRTLEDGPRHKSHYEYQVVYSLTESSPVEIHSKKAIQAHDGELYAESSTDLPELRVGGWRPDPPFPNPVDIWLRLYHRTLEEVLAGAEVRYVSEQKFGETSCLVFQLPDRLTKERVCQIWIELNERFAIPRRIASGRILSSGEFDDAVAVEAVETGETDQGIPYPKVLSRRLYAGWGRKICFNDDTYTCVGFAAQVPVSERDFRIAIVSTKPIAEARIGQDSQD